MSEHKPKTIRAHISYEAERMRLCKCNLRLVPKRNMLMYWLSYGGGVNSTALMVLLCEGRLPRYVPWRAIFADTGDEKDETYAYIDVVILPYLLRHGRELLTVRDKETVLERWTRLKCTGSRIFRACTDHSKIRPMERLCKALGDKVGPNLIGIDIDQLHRARPAYPGEREKIYPLVEEGIDRAGCVEIIERAGLPVPVKSGCWHCPFMRTAEILDLAVKRPDRMRIIMELEVIATQTHGTNTKTGGPRTQWGDTPAKEWARRACNRESAGPLFRDTEEDPPCGCYDG